MPRSDRPLLPGPPPRPIIGWRGTLHTFHSDPLRFILHLRTIYGPVAAIQQGSTPIVCFFEGSTVDQMLADDRCRPLHTLPSPQLTPENIDCWHAASLRFASHTFDQWVGGQVADVQYVMRRIALQSALAAFSDTDLPADAADQIAGTLERYVSDLFQPRVVSSERTSEVNGTTIQHAGLPGPEDLRRYVALLPTWSALAFGWTVLLLSQHLGVLDDLRTEIMQSLSAGSSSEQVLRLPFLDGVVRESLRLLPPLSIGVQVASAPVSVDGFDLPAGTRMLYSPYVLQRSAEIYFAPDRFRPQRWNQIDPPPIFFVPFGADAPAQQMLPLVVAQVKIVLAILLQRYTLVPIPGLDVQRRRSLLLAPQHDLSMIITPSDRVIPKREVHGNIRDVIQFP